MAIRDKSAYYGLDDPGMSELPDSTRLFLARRKQQKRLGKDVYDRRKEFFRTLHSAEGENDAPSAGAPELSENDRRKARRVRERSSK